MLEIEDALDDLQQAARQAFDEYVQQRTTHMGIGLPKRLELLCQLEAGRCDDAVLLAVVLHHQGLCQHAVLQPFEKGYGKTLRSSLITIIARVLYNRISNDLELEAALQADSGEYDYAPEPPLVPATAMVSRAHRSPTFRRSPRTVRRSRSREVATR